MSRLGLSTAIGLVAGLSVAGNAVADSALLGLRSGQHVDYARLVFDWTGPVDYTTRIEDGAVLVRFDRPVPRPSFASLEAVSAVVAAGALQPDGRTLRFALHRPARPVAFDFDEDGKHKVVVDLYPTTGAAGPVAANGPLQPATAVRRRPTVPPQIQLAQGVARSGGTPARPQLAQNAGGAGPVGDAYRAMLADPGSVAKVVAYAEAAALAGDYESAVGALEPLLIDFPDRNDLRADLGLLYHRLEAYPIAREHLTRALASGQLDANRRAAAERALANTETRLARNSWRAAVTLGGSYQTNANAGPSGSTVLSNGRDVALDDQFKARDDYNAFLSGWVEHRHDLLRQDEMAIVTDASVYITRQKDIEDNNLIYAQLSPGVEIKPLRESAPSFTVRPHGHANVVALSDELFSLSYGAGVDLQADVSDDTRVKGRLRHIQRDYYESNRRPFAGDRDGWENRATAEVQHALTDDVGLSLRGDFQHVYAEEQRNANIGGTVTGRADVRYPAPIAFASPFWRAYLSAAGEWTDYAAPDDSVDPTRERFDSAWRVTLGNRIEVLEKLDLNTEFQASQTNSNIDNYDRKNLRGTVSLTKRF